MEPCLELCGWPPGGSGSTVVARRHAAIPTTTLRCDVAAGLTALSMAPRWQQEVLEAEAVTAGTKSSFWTAGYICEFQFSNPSKQCVFFISCKMELLVKLLSTCSALLSHRISCWIHRDPPTAIGDEATSTAPSSAEAGRSPEGGVCHGVTGSGGH
ncbi:hypothetical protein Y1Q_0024508 [Alligator mississippiensis]|uniref:Uncharacterized protein n=1 Tax=Alligator mississippiensis TaxID=8496 RepID=A0A151NAW3_ALLMI|nr:hypothetical protein Y1Q_0024508 [Alligator mississippiensis]